MNDKRGIELALDTVIIAVIGLLVLAVIIFILADNLFPINKKLACNRASGRCQADPCDYGEITPGEGDPAYMGCPAGDRCCRFPT